jgi:hypothetical protein
MNRLRLLFLALALPLACAVIAIACHGSGDAPPMVNAPDASSEGGHTVGGNAGVTVTGGPANVANASGTLPAANGGSGISIGCGAPSATCGPCQISSCDYWSPDVNVVLDGGAPFTWTSVCNGVVTAPITVSPTYTANCIGTHHCMTYTKSTAMAMNQPDAAAFAAIAAPYTYGVTFAGVGGLTTNTYPLDFGPTQGLVGVVHTSAGALDCNNSTLASAPVPYQNAKLVQLLCTQVVGLSQLSTAESFVGGVVAGTSTTGGTHAPGGGITIGNIFNGQDANGAADNAILSVLVCSKDLTPLERAGYRSWESNYLGGI